MGDPGDSRRRRRGEAARKASRSKPGRLGLEIVRAGGDWSAFTPLARSARAAADALADLPQLQAAALGTATLVLSDDAHVRELNRIWRGKDKPTNVLSFPAGAIAARSENGRQLGDIVLAAETLLAEAARDGIPPRHHFQHLVVHGLLHLLGHDHETAAEAAVMEALEVAALARLGVADPYRDGVLETAS